MDDFTPCSVAIHGDRRITLRPVTLKDADGLWALDRLLAVVGHGVVRTPEEVPRNPEETELSIRKWLTRDLGIFVVAELDGQVVGQARVSVPPLARLAHNGTFEVSVHPDFQGIGIGRALTEACLAWAREAGLIQVSLSVIASNTCARTLYEHCGFQCEGGRHLYIRHPDGSFEDDVLMVWVNPELSNGTVGRTAMHTA